MKRTIHLFPAFVALLWAMPAFADLAPFPGDPNCMRVGMACTVENGQAGTCTASSESGYPNCVANPNQDPNGAPKDANSVVAPPPVAEPTGGCSSTGPFAQGALLVLMAGAGLLVGRRRA